jgi:hypothetical protein
MEFLLMDSERPCLAILTKSTLKVCLISGTTVENITTVEVAKSDGKFTALSYDSNNKLIIVGYITKNK